MTLDLRDSVQKWRHHFQAMARGGIPPEELYVVNQRGRGMGSNGRSRTMYKIQSGGQSGVSSIPSAATKGYAMALGRIQESNKKRTSRSKPRTGIKRKSNSGGVRKVVKRQRRNTKPVIKRKSTKRKSTNKKTTSKRKRTSTKKTAKRKIKDVFR